jgi:hypothetical protein
MLHVIRETMDRRFGSIVWECKCDCGNICLLPTESIGKTKSCGCLAAITATKHGYCNYQDKEKIHVFYVWSNMLRRCNSKGNIGYANYGGRGISVCERWFQFSNFIQDMGDPPTPLHEIDRIDNDGNYEPGNCKWSTPKEQARNKRTTKWIEHDGQVKSLAEWCEVLGLPYKQTWKRIEKFNWTIQECIETAPRKQTLSKYSIVSINGKSASIEYWCGVNGIRVGTALSRIKRNKFSVEDAVSVPTRNPVQSTVEK